MRFSSEGVETLSSSANRILIRSRSWPIMAAIRPSASSSRVPKAPRVLKIARRRQRGLQQGEQVDPAKSVVPIPAGWYDADARPAEQCQECGLDPLVPCSISESRPWWASQSGGGRGQMRDGEGRPVSSPHDRIPLGIGGDMYAGAGHADVNCRPP